MKSHVAMLGDELKSTGERITSLIQERVVFKDRIAALEAQLASALEIVIKLQGAGSSSLGGQVNHPTTSLLNLSPNSTKDWSDDITKLHLEIELLKHVTTDTKRGAIKSFQDTLKGVNTFEDIQA
jgi:hypothetical protein